MPTPSPDFWRVLDELVRVCPLKIDRPRGAPHPRYSDLIYPLNYGYLEGTRSGDEGGIDVWVGSALEKTVTAVACTVDLHKRDAEVKILLGCTPVEAQTVLAFHNSGSQSAFLIERPADTNGK